MARQAICKETIKTNTVSDMKKIGVYKPEYDAIIDIYAELMEQYRRLTEAYKDSKYKYDEETMNGGSKKAPIVSTLESLRKDILQYSDRLCLNPKANKIEEPSGKKKSALGEALRSIET